MDRRSFLKSTVVAGAGAAAGTTLSAPAYAQGREEWRMVTTWPKNSPGLSVGAQRCADRIKALTDGRISVKVFAAGELFPAFEVFDAVSSGEADMYHGAEYYFVGKHPGFAFFTAVPMGFTAPEIDAWVMHGGGQKLWDDLAAPFGLKPFLCGNTGGQMGGWFKKDINSIDDLVGLNVRMPGLGGEALRQLGVNVVVVPNNEIFKALKSGQIDGTEWVGPWNDLAIGFYREANNYYYPGFHEPGAALSASVNKAKFDALSTSDQAAVQHACLAENSVLYAEYVAKNSTALDALVNQHGVQLKRFSDDIYNGFNEASEAVVGAVAEHDDLGKRILDSFRKARREYAGWTRISDQAYSQERSRVLGITD